ncbi:RNA polymerase factor sigma-54 [Pontibacillus sp. HMF3514]|uniref:RNA polymerase factor sigma-54 n=1 Tax=Pontibacillus sp. HMF3514 TaxID=2692425 RepID=UPI001320547F|nr:RNA polymerase factor sigma-54 [Pontibacillus sp. HMF3514]QHE53528.1 RNA polymerase factor sigma-54 [Pontibacillus sp. HMF3514]
MNQQLTQEQKLTWKMTQKMSQAIEMLTYNGIELNQFLEDQVSDNPLIHIKPQDTSFASGAIQPELHRNERSVHQYLHDQLLHISIPSNLKAAVEYGIDSTNDDGYLDLSLQEWQVACNIHEEQANKALEILQSLEPAGIGARTLQECIALQLQRQNAPQYITQIIQEDLQDVAEQNLDAISAKYECTIQEAEHAISLIQSCHPRPALQVAPVKQDYIVPDAKIYKEAGQWRFELSPFNQPSISIEESLLNLTTHDTQAKEYIHEKYQHAQCIQTAILKRTINFSKVLEQIVNRQSPFFEKGYPAMRPLRMREIAEETNIHVSTVSRAVKNKFVQTPQGIVSLKAFFQTGLQAKGGEETSSQSIKQLIKETVQTEDQEKPYSDQALSDRLHREFGIYISRRTVAKYREALHIPSSSKRKKKGSLTT